jgi:hypothetical protein
MEKIICLSVLIVLVFFYSVLLYSLLRVASWADDKIEEMRDEREV